MADGWNKVWTDAELYKRFKLTKEEISYIEELIKSPNNVESLFDTESQINPSFGVFNLIDYGVEVGDTIVYNNELELKVCENNMVEYAGEKYTLAQFTAKFMPRNKHSKSGFIQGPKYFSYKGISLYKLKESFFKGKKK